MLRHAATDSIGVTAPATTWYLAEGCTGVDPSTGTFETWVLVQNPSVSATNVHLTYMTPSGPVSGPTFSLDGGSRRSFNVADTLPNCWNVSTRVTSDRPVVAERSMYFDTPAQYRQAATDSIGVTAGRTNWYLAEGSTGVDPSSGSFETWVLVQNPGSTPATTNLTYMTSNGPVKGPSFTLEPMSRKSVNVAETVPNCWSVSTRVTSDLPVVAERSMYWSAPGCPRQAATDSIGAASAQTKWCLAEGSTGSNEQGSFETWVLIQNPGPFPAAARLTYMTSQGPVTGPTVTLPPNSRMTVNAAETVRGVWDISTEVTSDEPVVVERAMYWDAPGVPRQAATDSIGVAQ